VDYVIKWPKLNYGITYQQFRKLAYGCGRRLQIKFPNSWIDKNLQKLSGFWALWKDTKTTLRQRENTSLSSTTAFNGTNRNEFFDNYDRALKSWNFIAGRLYDNEETGGSRQYSLLILLRKLGNQADDFRKNWKLGVG